MKVATLTQDFQSWLETHFEVVKAITIEWMKDEPCALISHIQASSGRGGLYELAQELTDEFETLHADTLWDGEFFDTIDAFLTAKFQSK